MPHAHAEIPRALIPEIREALRTFRVTMITGPRQAGKSTAARQAVGGRPFHALSLDDPDVRASVEFDLMGTLDRPNLVLVDEFQLGGDPLVRTIKRLVDDDPRKGRFLLTGSTRFLTVRNLSESLAGRVAILDLWPLSQAEIERRAETFVDRLFDARVPLRDVRPPAVGRGDVAEIVCSGGFPELLGASAAARRRWYESYVRTITDRDVPDIATIRSVSALRSSVRLLATRTAQELNVASLTGPLRLTAPTVASYLDLLESVYLWYRLPGWSRNPTQKVVKHPKAHFVDSGLAAHLLGVGPDALSDPGAPAFGPLLETFAVGEVARMAGGSSARPDLFHFRDRDGLEVDLVLETRDGRVALVEVKATRSLRADDFRPIQRLADKIGDSFAGGVILHLGDKILPFGPKLTALPISILWAK